MAKAGKNWRSESGAEPEKKQAADKKTERLLRQAQPRKPDDIKEDEKLHGLVDEDHPFPSKGN